LGSSEAIRQALTRLQKSGLLMRIAQGIYYYPKINKNKYISKGCKIISLNDLS
jgi:predicted transcriptional regulator of viral defense system